MDKLHKESAIVIIGSFIGAAFAVGFEKIFKDPLSIWNWIGFIIFIVVLFFLAKFLLRPYIK